MISGSPSPRVRAVLLAALIGLASYAGPVWVLFGVQFPPRDLYLTASELRAKGREHSAISPALRRPGHDPGWERDEIRRDRQYQPHGQPPVRRSTASRSGGHTRIEDLVPQEFREMVLSVAARYELDARLLAAIITVESNWDPTLVDRHGDAGLMQIIPGTARWIASVRHLQSYDIMDPQTNLDMGAWYLQLLLKKNGNVANALSEYNGGPGFAARGQDHPYTRVVLRTYAEQALPADQP